LRGVRSGINNDAHFIGELLGEEKDGAIGEMEADTSKALLYIPRGHVKNGLRKRMMGNGNGPGGRSPVGLFVSWVRSLGLIGMCG